MHNQNEKEKEVVESQLFNNTTKLLKIANGNNSQWFLILSFTLDDTFLLNLLNCKPDHLSCS